MTFREKRRREKSLKEKRLSGRNVFLPILILSRFFMNVIKMDKQKLVSRINKR